MPTTAEYLARLVQAKTDIATAITNKGGTVNSGDGLEEFPADIATIPTGGSVEEKDVNFYDYDGTLLHSYTKAEFLALTEMPENPTHTGLTAKGWNWTLQEAQTYVTTYGVCDIGEMYDTDDESTRVYITVTSETQSIRLTLSSISGNSTGVVNWGDNSSDNISISMSREGSLIHTYNNVGDYVIKINRTGGSSDGYFHIPGNANSPFNSYFITDPNTASYSTQSDTNYKFWNIVNKVEVGKQMTIRGFAYCYNLKYILISYSYPYQTIYENTFYRTTNLKHITIPTSVKRLCNQSTSGLAESSGIDTISLPSTLTYINRSGFNSNYKLKHVTIPSSVDAQTGGSFSGCYSLKYATQPQYTATNVTSYNSNAQLKEASISSNATSIGSNTFTGCYSLNKLTFKPTTPPTVSNSNTFTSIPTNCIIYVPALISNLYMTASNYPNPTKYKYIGYATYTSGDTLPTLTTDETYTLTWYATVEDAIAGTNPITQGNGNEVYSIATAVV